MVTRPATPAWIAEAGRFIRAGRLVAFPTETVYGLGANGLDAAAVRGIFEAKGRPSDNPLILHVAQPDDAKALATVWPDAAEALQQRFWPGPLTLVVPSDPRVPMTVRAGLDTVAIRCPAHPVARAVIRAAGVPVAAPSANRSGRPSPTRAEDVARDLEGRVALILDGGPADVGVESTVIDVSGPLPLLLRPGGLAAEAIVDVVGPLGQADATGPVRAPGMKYRHYAPEVPVVLVALSGTRAARRIQETWAPGTVAVLAPTAVLAELGDQYPAWDLGPTAETAARRLFSGLRVLDRPDVTGIVAVWDEEAGLGRAVWNRLEKAAGEVWR